MAEITIFLFFSLADIFQNHANIAGLGELWGHFSWLESAFWMLMKYVSEICSRYQSLEFVLLLTLIYHKRTRKLLTFENQILSAEELKENDRSNW